MCACMFEYIFVLVNNRDSVNGGVYTSLLFAYTGSVLCELVLHVYLYVWVGFCPDKHV